MASTYSTSLRLELMATGDQSGTWGDTTNTNLGTLLEQAITGVLSVAQGDVANFTPTSLNGASDQARNAVINLTGAMTANRNMVVPNANKLYLVKNSTTGGFTVTVKTSAGTGVAVAAGTAQWVYADGTNVVQGLSGTMAVQAPSAVAITGGTVDGLTSLSTTGATAGFVGFQTVSTEAAAAAGPIIDLYRNSASPAASDVLGRVLFSGKDSAGNVQEYGSIQAVIADATSTSEDSSVDHYAVVAGARTRIISVGPNLDLAAVGQIKFPATENASSDPNTLDDYQEGTWTPTITPGAGSYTTTSGSGSYWKVGNLVSFQVTITITNVGTGINGTQFTLPFTPNASNASVAYGRENALTGLALVGRINNTATVLTTTYAAAAWSTSGAQGVFGGQFYV